MSIKLDKTNLGYLGAEYQYRLVKCFMEDEAFFQSLYSVINQNVFTEPLLKQLVGVLKDYYKEAGVLPSYETIGEVLKARARMSNEVEEWDALLTKIRKESSEGCEFVKENSSKFFMQQNMIKVANEIIRVTSDGDVEHYAQCAKMMQDALEVGKENEDGFNPYDMLELATSIQSRHPIPTGIPIMDERLNGGLDKKKLGVVIGPAGFGKTSLSTAMASYASTCPTEDNNYEGYKVLQILFEDDETDIARKHFSRITQVEAQYLSSSPEQIATVREKLENFDKKNLFINNLRVKKFKTRKETVGSISSFIRRLINKGFKPDLVILDYFECLAFEKGFKNASKWDLQEDTMRDLECLAEEFNVALWVMTQGNKDSFIAEVVRMDQAGGSITKVQIGHVIMSIARTLDDQANNRAVFALLKNRQGATGVPFKVKFNNGTSTVSCEEIQDVDELMAYNEEITKQKESVQNTLAQQIQQSMLKKEREVAARNEAFDTERDNIPAPDPGMGEGLSSEDWLDNNF